MSRIRKLGVAALVTGPLLAGTLVYSNLANAAGPWGPETCLYGYVWREVTPADRVCVTPDARNQVVADDAAHASRVVPGGAYGPNTCQEGFVWREAVGTDQVCVTPEQRARAVTQNQIAAERYAIDSFAVRGKIDDGAGVYGHAELSMGPEGDFRFFVHLNNSNAVVRTARVVCTVKLLSGGVLTFSVKEDLPGKLRFWESSKKDITKTGKSGEIANRWAEIPKDLGTMCKTSTKVNGNQLVGETLQGALFVIQVLGYLSD
jgi:hypothetical protein